MNCPCQIKDSPFTPHPGDSLQLPGRGVRGAAIPGRWWVHWFSQISPIVCLLLIPKCPACLAADIAILTGLSLSFSIASQLRTFLIVLSVACGAVVLFRIAHRRLLSRSIDQPAATANHCPR